MNQSRAVPELTSAEVTQFWQRVDCGARDACWPWNGPRSGDYGFTKVRGQVHRAHRIALSLSIRDELTGFVACHSCDNPPCCNPAHLWKGTNRENILDRVRKGRTKGIAAVPGEGHPIAKLTVAAVVAIRGEVSRSVGSFAKEYGVTRRTIRDARCGLTWSHVDARHPRYLSLPTQSAPGLETPGDGGRG